MLRRARVVLAVIGSGWISEMPRLRDKGDWIRIEISMALERQADCLLIPVLVDDSVRMPKAGDLPRILRPFAGNRHAAELHQTSWKSDFDRLAQHIKNHLQESAGSG